METILQNRKARFNYHILDTWEAGIVLKGSEVKSIIEGGANIAEAWIRFKNGEAWLTNCNINKYKSSTVDWNAHEPLRERKLLLHKKELRKIANLMGESNTLVPLDMHLNERRKIKITVALCKGKKTYDKRETLRKRDFERYGD
jgi:SsrA-binding protein